jgi:uncharacterized protein
MNGEVSHFEIPAKKVERAKAFYSDVFGWKTSTMPMASGGSYTSLTTTEVGEDMRPKKPGAINGGMPEMAAPLTGPVITVEVDDITATLKVVETKGGKTVVKRTSMGEYGAYGYFKDTEGNLMGLYEQPKK